MTNRDSRSVEKYLQEITKEKLLTTDEEVELAKRIRKGDMGALEKLTRGNLRFVVSVAKQYPDNSLSLNDLINEGNLGLIKAAQRFDETLGFKFITYAVWWIRQSILQAIAEQGRMVRLPLQKVGSLTKINKVISELEQTYQREPTPEEVAMILDVSVEEVEATSGISGRHISIDEPFSEASDSDTLVDVLENPNAERTDVRLEHTASLCMEIERVLASLSTRENKIIRMSFGIGMEHAMSYKDIGGQLELSAERVRQIFDKALDKLRAQPQEPLKAHLG